MPIVPLATHAYNNIFLYPLSLLLSSNSIVWTSSFFTLPSFSLALTSVSLFIEILLHLGMSSDLQRFLLFHFSCIPFCFPLFFIYPIAFHASFPRFLYWVPVLCFGGGSPSVGKFWICSVSWKWCFDLWCQSMKVFALCLILGWKYNFTLFYVAMKNESLLRVGSN